MELPRAGILAALVVASLVPAQAAKHPWVDEGRLEFRLPDLDGRFVNSSDARFEGKVVLVDLWATWCPPCVTEIPTLIEIQNEYADQGLIVVAIAFEADEQPEARRRHLEEFKAKHDITYLVLDGGHPNEIGSAIPAVRNVTGFPIEIFIDRSGQVTRTRNSYGFKKSWAKKLHREVENLLGEGRPGQQDE